MKKDNIPGLEGYYISRLGTLWSRYISRRGAANPNAKLSKAQRREIRFRYESREKICRLANEFKVSRLTIRRIVNPSLRSFNRLV